MSTSGIILFVEVVSLGMALRIIWKVGPVLGSAMWRIHFRVSYGAV